MSRLRVAVALAVLAALSPLQARANDTIALPEIEISARPPGAAARAAFDRARERILPKFGPTSTTLDRTAIEALPQGERTPFDRLLLQLPGVSADSAASHPDFHIRRGGDREGRGGRLAPRQAHLSAPAPRRRGRGSTKP